MVLTSTPFKEIVLDPYSNFDSFNLYSIPMKKRSHIPCVKTLMKEIEAFNAENNLNNTNRVRYYKGKLKDLGGEEKKYQTPFKHRLVVNKRRKDEKKNKNEERQRLGLPLGTKKHKR